VKAYCGEPLAPDAAIAVVANDALGNFVLSTVVLQALRAAYPGARLVAWTGPRVADAAPRLPFVDEVREWLGHAPSELAPLLKPEFDLVLNLESTGWGKTVTGLIAAPDGSVCGPCIDARGRGDLAWPDNDRGRLWADKGWVAPDLKDRYPYLSSGFIGEIFCRLAYLDGPIPRYQVPVDPPPFDVPRTLIATAASLPSKLWPSEKWVQLARELGGPIGLLGAAPERQREHWKGADAEESLIAEAGLIDLRGRLTLPEVAGALSLADRVITIDNGILHVAAAVDAPIVGLFRHGIHRLWAPPAADLTVLTPGDGYDVAAVEVEAVLRAARAFESANPLPPIHP